jgi:acyl-coenzyme A synthetase/AMP-(fatty) acid ligase
VLAALALAGADLASLPATSTGKIMRRTLAAAHQALG